MGPAKTYYLPFVFGLFGRRELTLINSRLNYPMQTTYSTKMIQGIPIGVPNVVEPAVGYYVSYNNYDRAIYGADTTAIRIDKSGAFLILNGDHRNNLRGLSLEDACEYFHSNSDKKNFRSDNHQDDYLREVDGVWKMVRIEG
jgi:hypothetical protein